MPKRLQPAVAYLRTSSAANVGVDKDSDKRQRRAIEAFAKRAGFIFVDEYYDAAVSGADPIDQRPGFVQMLRRLATNGAKTIIVESPDRFARDLAVQLAGHDMLKSLGISIIPASAPDFSPRIRPRLFWFARCWARSLSLRRRARLRNSPRLASVSVSGKGGAKEGNLSARQSPRLLPSHVSYAGGGPKRGQLSLREVSKLLAAQGFLNERGKPYAAKSVASMLC